MRLSSCQTGIIGDLGIAFGNHSELLTNGKVVLKCALTLLCLDSHMATWKEHELSAASHDWFMLADQNKTGIQWHIKG